MFFHQTNIGECIAFTSNFIRDTDTRTKANSKSPSISEKAGGGGEFT